VIDFSGAYLDELHTWQDYRRPLVAELRALDARTTSPPPSPPQPLPCEPLYRKEF